MEKQKYLFDQLSIIFSEERLHSYLNHSNCNKSKFNALIFYSWNIQLSQALYPMLQILEIALRNSLHNSISELFQTDRWFNLDFLYDLEKIQIKKAKEKLQKNNKPMYVGRLIAELSFGFWTSFFDIRYEHDQILWPKLLKSTFPYLSKKEKTRAFLSRELNRIRILRNRISHHEPIWHWKDLLAQHESILNIIKGLSIPASEYLFVFDQFKEIYFNGKFHMEKKLNQLHSNFHFPI